MAAGYYMQRGQKQSPFIGKRVQEVENGVPILYPRYKSVSEILLPQPSAAAQQGQDHAAAVPGSSKKRPAPDALGEAVSAAPAATANGHTANDTPHQPAGKKFKQEPKTEKHKPHAEDSTGIDEQQAVQGNTTTAAAGQPATAQQLTKQQKKELKKKAKQQQQAAQANGVVAEHHDTTTEQQQQQAQAADALIGHHDQQPQPTGNAQEAAAIRSVLGFTDTSSRAAPSFNFKFSMEQQVAQETEKKLAGIMMVDTATKDGYVPRRVFVGGMPYHYSEEGIREYWGYCGEIESLDMMTFPDSGRFKGIVFITFASEEATAKALECNGEQLEGQTLKVDKCKASAAAKKLKSQPSQPPAPTARPAQLQPHQAGGNTPPAATSGHTGAAQKTPGYNVAYVGNIAFEVSPDELQKLFTEYGVTKIRLHTDKDTGKSKGFAHVHFADEGSLDRAMQLDGTLLAGRNIRVGYAQAKKN